MRPSVTVVLAAALAAGVATAGTVTFDADHVCHVDGQRFFPIGIFNVPVAPADRTTLARSLRFNTIQSYLAPYSGQATEADYQTLMSHAAAAGLFVMPEVMWTGATGRFGETL